MQQTTTTLPDKVNDKHCFFCDSVPFGNCEELSWFPLHPEFQ